MRYDRATDKIIISCREFAMTAKRGISRALPFDADEPQNDTIPDKVLNRIIEGRNPTGIDYDFSADGYSFTLSCMAEKQDKCNLWFAFSVDSNPTRPKREFVASARAEAFITAHVCAELNGYDMMRLNFVYINCESGEYAEAEEYVSRAKLSTFFKRCLVTVSLYAKPEIERVTVRLPSMSKLKFPYDTIREGQSEFIRKAYKNIARGGTLYATAPTGTGKTISALFPAVRALGELKRDKIFYLTPKETTAAAAIDCILLMEKHGAVIRAIKISAKEKKCKNGLRCRDNRDDCENARMNKLRDATLELYNLEKTVVSDADVEGVSKKYKVCPYELTLAYSELCDVVICDFNYLFDPAVYIRRFFTEGGNFVFLIDEAHNLPDRAREMYSAEINEAYIASPSISTILGEFSKTKAAARDSAKSFYNILFPYVKEEMTVDEDGQEVAAAHLKDIPGELYGIFDTLISTVEEEIYKTHVAVDDEKNARLKLLNEYYYSLKKFRSVMHAFDDGYEMFIFYKSGEITVRLYCIDTGRRISERIEKGRAAVFFSATLTPLYYYKSLLGADRTSDTLEVDSPFDTDQLSVSIMDKISTRLREREETLLAVCRVIAATVSAKRGNYIIFSPSFAYSEALSKIFSHKYPKIKTITQKRSMSAEEREKFLSEFSADDKSYLIAFCVMGGIYSEGIDLAGDKLIGAVIVGIGMPSLSYEREAICAYYDERYEEGKQFAYIYPGMNRVLQAAGRVIRTEDDRGVIVLIDDRFDDPVYKKTIPKLWKKLKFLPDAKILREKLDEFWREVSEE